MANYLLHKKALIILLVSSLLMLMVSCGLFIGEPAVSGSAGFASGGARVTNIDDKLSFSGSEGTEVLENFSLKLNNRKYKGDIAYRSVIQDMGWQAWKPGGEMSGTAGEGKAIFGVQIMLTGHLANYYDLSYRVNLQTSGWQEWVSNGTVSGKIDEPVIGLEIKLEEKQGDIRDSAWTITEYSDDSGNQAEFYTMKNNDDGTLIVIDGGYDANTEQVRSIINILGGRVDYWFLTHYDEDHACAFNNIYADPQGIEIGAVYCTPLDYDYYLVCAADRWWDVPWVYEIFLAQTSDDDRIHYLARDDVFEIDGLTIEVFNSYDQMIVDTGSPDVANYASLLFKISGEKDSFLVCGDVYGDLWIELSAMYGEKLEAEYVQLGHHGNNHVPPEAWAVVNADAAFFDGPAWLTESDDYSAKGLKEWCDASGIKTYTFDTAPNSLPFE